MITQKSSVVTAPQRLTHGKAIVVTSRTLARFSRRVRAAGGRRSGHHESGHHKSEHSGWLGAALTAVAGASLLSTVACGSPPSSAVSSASVSSASGVSTGSSASGTTAGASRGAPSSSPSGYTERTVGQTGFAAPSRNIGCTITVGGVTCYIAKKSWTAPPKPASCAAASYGSELDVSAHGTAEVTCAGLDDPWGNDPGQLKTASILAYGTALRTETMRCVSETAAIRCESLSSGHGFTVSTEAYTLF